ncbi:MAG: response regulator transcription factor [Mycobacterium sp.]|nr:response regulator transcription factor [Mycobacterium sp.]
MGPGTYRAALGAPRGSVVLCEDDSAIAADLMEDAAHAGLDTTWCRNGAETLLAVGAGVPDVLIIAARTATVDATSITSAVRGTSELPILVGAAPGEEDLARPVLAAGASAVIVRPYDIATIARFARTRGSETAVLTAGPIHVDRHGYETQVRGREVQLTQRELDLLVFLIERRGKVASSEEISRAVWGRPSDTNTVAVHVKRLRRKLGNDPEHGEFIRTIRGAGYRLAPSICA